MSQSNQYSNYNGLQAAYIKETGKLNFDFNFTWSKTLGTVLQENPFTVRAGNYGMAAIDRPFVFNSTYTLPDRRFQSRGNDWSDPPQWLDVSGISTWQAGGSLLALLGNNVPNFGLSESYSNCPIPTNGVDSPEPRNQHGISSATYYGTEAALAIQPVLDLQSEQGSCNVSAPPVEVLCSTHNRRNDNMLGEYGGQKYPHMSMGSYFDNDLALYRTIHIHNTQNIQFRISAFDWLNHPLPEFSSANQVTLRYLVDYPSKTITLNTGTGGTSHHLRIYGYEDRHIRTPASSS